MISLFVVCRFRKKKISQQLTRSRGDVTWKDNIILFRGYIMNNNFGFLGAYVKYITIFESLIEITSQREALAFLSLFNNDVPLSSV